MVIKPEPLNIRRKGTFSLPLLARANRPPAGRPSAGTAAFPRVRRSPAPAERGSVTRSNIHQPERIRMNIIASMRLAMLLRLVFNTVALRQAGAGRPSIKAPIKAKSPVIVHDQGRSRQRPEFLNAAVGRDTPCAPAWQTQTPPLADNLMSNLKILVRRRRRAGNHPPYLASPIRLRMMAGHGGGVGGATVPGLAALLRLVFNPASLRSGRSIKAKTPAIVHDQGRSRQRRLLWGAASGYRHHVPKFGGGYRSYRPEDIYWWGNTQACARGLAPAWAITLRAFSPPAKADGRQSGRSIKAKTPAIVHDQGRSRQRRFFMGNCIRSPASRTKRPGGGRAGVIANEHPWTRIKGCWGRRVGDFGWA